VLFFVFLYEQNTAISSVTHTLEKHKIKDKRPFSLPYILKLNKIRPLQIRRLQSKTAQRPWWWVMSPCFTSSLSEKGRVRSAEGMRWTQATATFY